MEPYDQNEQAIAKFSASAIEGRVLDRPHIQPTEGMTLADYWRILVKRKWVIVTATVITLSLVLIVSLRVKPKYTAVSKIALGRSTNILNFKGTDQPMAIDDNDQITIDTQVKVLQSESLAIQTIRRLGLDRRKEFAGSQALDASPTSSDASSTAQITRETDLIARLQGRLKVAPVPETTIIEVYYSDENPRTAAEISNGVVQTYIEQNIRSKFDSTMQAADFLSKQLADLQIKMETSQEKLVKYQKEHNILGIDEKQNIVTTKLDALNRQLTDAQADRIQKQSWNELVKAGDKEAIASILQDPSTLALRAQLNDLQTQMAQLSVQFGPSYPRVTDLRTRIAQVQISFDNEIKKGITRIRSEYQVAMQREQMLHNALEQQKQEANALNESAIEYKILKQETESNRQLYEGLLQKMKEATVSASMNSSNIRVIDAARVPLSPSSPNIPRNLEFGFIFGIVLGVASAFSLELLDNTVRTADQTEKISGVAVLAMIPDHSAMPKKKTAGSAVAAKTTFYNIPVADLTRQKRIVALTEPRSELAEAYRALRTSILLSNPGTPAKVLVFTSCLPQEGKTTTAVNVAVLLAQQGKRVLLVDADMRRPSIHKVFQLRSTNGLSLLLSGNCTMEEAVIQVPEMPTLSVVPAGKLPPHPSELLGGPTALECIRRWRADYDHVIIDTPPLLSVTDALLLSVKADSTIFIVRAGRTSTVALRRARNLLASMHVHVMGSVLNAIDLSSPDHYHYYYSGYSGGYYSQLEPVAETHGEKAQAEMSRRV